MPVTLPESIMGPQEARLEIVHVFETSHELDARILNWGLDGKRPNSNKITVSQDGQYGRLKLDSSFVSYKIPPAT